MPIQSESCRTDHSTQPERQQERGRREQRRVGVQFGDSIGEVVRRRIGYALRVFCAVFGYEYVDCARDSRATTICYGSCSKRCPHVRIAAGYAARPLTQPAPGPNYRSIGEPHFPRFHPAADGETDWLGEIFEWLSAADELAIDARDSCGRIPFHATLHGRYKLDPYVPYAALAMHGLRDAIEDHVAQATGPGKPRRRRPEQRGCTIVATHDIDFLPVSSAGTIRRFLKNIAIAAIAYHDLRLATSILRAGLRQLTTGPAVLDCLPAMLAGERRADILSTCNVLCRQGHRRDANYNIDDPAALAFVKEMASRDVEIGLHGSYTSLDAPGHLAEEYRRLSRAGYLATGGRQHWLRYRDHTLFDELCRAGATYDCSVGFSERIGFRAGACFAYPPYDFRTESAYPLLEIPLVIMDTALYCESRDRESWPQMCDKVLTAVRRYGSGGVSVLWHDTAFHGGQLPPEMGDLYWQLKRENETWTSCRSFVNMVRPQFVDAGLLPTDFAVPSDRKEVA